MVIATTIDLSSLDGSNGFRLDGADERDFSGRSVSNAGDVNGDGFDDVIVGALFADPNGDRSGSSYVVFGKASGFSATLNLSSLDGSNGFRLDGVTAFDQSGFSVSDMGDVNGDGFDDVIVGAPESSFSYVVFGKAGGFSATLNLSSLDGSNGFRLDGVTAFDRSGFSVSDVGDVNGDGFDDVIVGAPGYSSSNPYGGGTYSSSSSYVVLGKASGFDATLELSSLDGSNGFRLDGVAGGDSSGASVSSAGDVNGDGFDDVIVGAFGADPNGDRSGSSYVVFGKAGGFDAAMDLSSLDGSNGFRLDGVDERDYSGFSVSSAGDVNGDGFDDVIVGATGANSSYVVFGKSTGFDATLNLSSLDGSNGFCLDGAGRVSTAGDVNGDGFDDVIVGAPDVDSSYVIFGKVAGFSATLDLLKLDSNSGLRLDGGTAYDRSGFSVSGGGDVNGDGFDDLIVGAPDADPNGYGSGSSYVLFGSSHFDGTVTYVGTLEDDILTGTSADERFEGGDGNDTLIGGGGADIFDGEDGDDVIRVPDLDFQTLNGGTGTDTLELTGGGIDLNLASFHDPINDIEAIDLTGSGDNTLTFTLPDLLSLSNTHIFTVDGDAGDRVVGIGPGWADEGIEGGYHIYTNRGTIVRVDVAVSADSPPPGVISLFSLNGSNGFRLDGVAANDYSGTSVSNAGDVNGDGFDDVIVGAPGANSSYVVFGKASGFDATLDLSSLDGSNGFTLNGVTAEDALGYSISSAGDVNGDGFADVIIGARGANSSYVVFGKSAGFDGTLNLSSLDGGNGFRLDGAAGDFSARSVSSAGDVNGDGFDDVIVGAPNAEPNGRSSGTSYVVFGKASGFDATLDLSSLDGSNGFRLNGVAAYDQSGSSVSSAGDVNGDGFDDVIVGAPYADPYGVRSGSSYVLFGKASGFDAALDLSSLDGSNGFRLGGEEASNYSGYSVSNAGDVNGDGFDDMIIGARGADPNDNIDAGSSYVVFGKASGFDAALDLSSLDGSNGFRLDGAAEYDYSGRSVSNAGDFNGDGFGDLIIGSLGDGFSSDYSGVSYVVYGKASGFDAALDLSSLDGSNGFRLDGAAQNDGAGSSVSTAGDVNGDGFDDLIVGARYADSQGEYSDSGSSYVLFGRSSFTDDGVIRGTPGNDNLIGTPAAERFEAGDGNDRMIGRGGADVFLGEAGNDYIRISDLDFESVDGGIGNDTLALGGSGLNLNLTDMGGKISGIETINLFGTGDNTLTLTAADVLNLSDTTNTLKVNGNEGDRIVGLSHGWGDGGVHGDFHTYFNDAAVLLVGVNVTTDFV
ncbi:integrin alpha [Nitrosomonas sp. Nm166]|uniref:beta strand repeat-containing protein n=1 Tax=Nitrosomonas sp. Nm166 TaxID=1881054 RepID=UPI0008E55949|nr:integrin alpha [Nitrosomonas sp. Nm166]SFE13129.1 FG-GAP repeat-containing protein [Nitrosomonas sp. Nm166]